MKSDVPAATFRGEHKAEYDHPPCCGSGCEGASCWDCRGTGHPHASKPESAPRRPCRHPSLDDECRACRIERRARNNAADALRSHVGRDS